MVRIDKSQISLPAILDEGGRGQLATEKFKTDHDKGIRKFSFSAKIYGHKTVKEALKKVQHGKCCFCEARIDHISHGDVEHFRPKAGFKSKTSDSLTKPGYFWLAYHFPNLFLACQICNQVFKKNYFPIVDETRRARSHHDDHRLEGNLMIDPGKDDPTEHLCFEQEVIKAKNGSEKGVLTIRRTGLDRKELEQDRFEYLQILKTLAKVARGQGAEAAEAIAHFKILGKANSVYSLMARSNFPDLI